MNNEGNNAAEKWLAGEFTSALKKAVQPKCQASNANTTLYVDQWTQVTSKLLPKSRAPMDIPAQNTINSAQCHESPTWPTVQHEHPHFYKPRDALH